MSCLDEQKLTTPWQHKALTKLLGLQYKIEYHRGATNVAADALSRLPESSMCALSVCVPTWLDEVKKGYQNDPACSNKLATAAAGAPLDGPFTMVDGLI